jgi:hypothetical protein
MIHETQQSGPSERARPAWLLPLLAIAVLVLISAIAYWFVTQGPGVGIISPRGSAVAEFSGDGDQTTESFSVREGWSIHWENSGSEFSFAITGDRDFGTVIDQDEPGSGVTSPVGEGTYQLEIQAEGPWEVRIVQGE